MNAFLLTVALLGASSIKAGAPLGPKTTGAAAGPAIDATPGANVTPAPAAAPAGQTGAAPAAAPGAVLPAGAQPPPPAEPPPEEEVAPLDAETMAFLNSGGATNDKDGAIKLEWPGPGGPQLKLSWDSLDKRNEEVFNAEMLKTALIGAVQSFYDGDGAIDTAGMRKKLLALMQGPVDEARTSYLNAIKAEERRLFFIERAVADARANREEIPGVDGRLVAKRIAALKDGRIKAEILRQLAGYKSLGTGLIAYLDGDTFTALKHVRDASEGLPETSTVFALLGSLYALYGQTDAAVIAWKRCLELDPRNQPVREAILQHSKRGK
jgi:hypothetical protein